MIFRGLFGGTSKPPEGRDLGKRGEDEAARVLKKNGYKVIERNFRCRRGEIDLIATDGETIVFVEVKARGRGSIGSPEEAVDSRKRDRIIKAAREYLMRSGQSDRQVRFDVVSVEPGDGKDGKKSFRTEIIKDAFQTVR
ncbi:MAG: YraN family protein [Thermodesulfobacteriota bacterium]